jgi:thiamine biosynthesis lipoprotein
MTTITKNTKTMTMSMTMITANMAAMMTIRTDRREYSTKAGPYWQHHAFHAMNTSITLDLFSDEKGWPTYVERLFQQNEACLSRFRPESELSRLNQNKRSDCAVSAELFGVLEAAHWVWHATGGLFNPAILPALERAGYDRSFEQIAAGMGSETFHHAQPQDGSHVAFPPAAPFDLDRNRRSIRRSAGTQLDLGGIGKGWTVDRAADGLQRAGPFLLNAGGDLYAHGYQDDTERGWSIAIEDPRRPDRSVLRIRLANRALATSSVARRRWVQAGSVQHHIIDPRIGRPAQTDCLSVTVIATRAMIAEAHAKVALILGVTEGLAYLSRLPNVEGMIVDERGELAWTAGFASFIDEAVPSVTTAQEV